MKYSCFIIFYLLLTLSIQALVVPVSDTPVLQDDNMLTNFVRNDPDDKKPEENPTKVWLWQQGNNLMIHFSCPIDSQFVVGPVEVRDEAMFSDYVSVQLITLPYAYFAYYYTGYPNGNLVDGIRKEDMSVDLNWDSKYSYKTSYDDKNWELTMQIPLGELRFKSDLPYNWYIILSRYKYATTEYYCSPYFNTNQKKDYFTAGHKIQLNQKITREFNLEFKPYFVKSYDLIEKTSSYDPDMVGLDIAYHPNPTTKIKLSMNPDFSEVPPDDAQDIYNLKYPPYYDENRFFFIEDLDAFGIFSDFFYSRNIVQPQLAYKATGSLGKTRWGILGAWDKKIVSEGELINPDDYFQLLSIIPTIGNFTMGNAFIARTNTGYYNYVYSGVYEYRLSKVLSLNTYLAGSLRKNENEEDNSLKKGYLGQIGINYYPGNWENSLNIAKISKDIFADAGYLYGKDRLGYSLSSYWQSNPFPGFLQLVSVLGIAEMQDLHPDDDKKTEYDLSGMLTLRFKPKFFYTFRPGYYSIYDNINQKHNVFSMHNILNFKCWKNFSLYINWITGETLVYALNKTSQMNTITFRIIGTPQKSLYYQVQGNLVSYDYPKENIIDINGIPLTLYLDNQYAIINASLRFTPVQRFRFTLGGSITTYETPTSYSNFNYYSNLRYEFKPNYFIYLGLKNNLLQDEPITFDEPLGNFNKTGSTVYVKISLSI